MQVSGRLIVANLPELENRINEQFARAGVRVVGISGSWRYLNPSIEIDHFTFGGSDFYKVGIEFDLVESLLRNRIIASRFRVASAHVKTIEREGEWRLYGSPGDIDFDFRAFISHTDEFSFNGTIEISNGRSSARIYADARAVNRSGRHRLDVVVSNEPGCEVCEIRLESDLTKPIFEMSKAEGFVKLNSSGLRLTEGLASIFSLPTLILEVDAAWSSDGTKSRTRADLSLNSINLPTAAMDVTLATAAIGVNDDYRGALSLDVMTPDENIVSRQIDYRVDEKRAVTIWTTAVDVGEWSALFVSALGSDKDVGLWFERLGANGSVRTLRLRIDSLGLAYEAQLAGLSVSAYKGVPELDEFRGWVRGDQKSLRIDIDDGPLHLGFPDQFGHTWDYNAASGSVTFWFEPGYLGLRGHDLVVSYGDTRAIGGLAFSGPRDPTERRLAILGVVDGMHFVDAKKYLPKTLSLTLGSWLRSSLVAGRLDEGVFVYHGHNRVHRDSPVPRVELTARVTDGEVSYHPDWPIAEAVDGRVEVTRRRTSVWVSQMVAFGRQIRDVTVLVPSPSKYVDIKLITQIPTVRALDFVRATPVADSMPYVTENWDGGGTIFIDADLRVPLQRKFEHDDLRIEFDVVDASLNAADFRLHFENLNGRISFRSPYSLKSQNFSGALFGFPVNIVIASAEESIELNFRGRSTLADVYRVLDISDPGVGSGEFRFNAQFEGHPGMPDSPSLHVVTDSVGIDLNLPAPLEKSHATPRVLETRIEFGDKYTSIEAIADVAEGWLHMRGGEVIRGGIGIGAAMESRDQSQSGVVVTGGIDLWQIGPNLLGEEPTSIPWRFNDFAVKRIELDAFSLNNVTLNGFIDGSDTAMDLHSNELTGFARNDGNSWRLILQELRIPSVESDGVSSPSYGTLINQLPVAEVSIEKLFIGQKDYGAWQFGLHGNDEGLHFSDLVAHVKGLYLEADEDVVWIKDANRSKFSGRIAAKDLADVISQWGQSANLEGESMDIYTDVNWPGSPLNFELVKLSGVMAVTLTDGRLLATKGEPAVGEASSVLSDAILNFSDVFPKGIGFDQLSAKTKLKEGQVQFLEPLELRGSGTKITISGAINFSDSTLDNEITVTLPLSSSLPWYAVWIATVNPASAAGVLIGGQVFKDQIDQFSSAKYKVGGTFEEPEVQLMDVITPKIERPEVGMDGEDGEANEENEVLEGE